MTSGEVAALDRNLVVVIPTGSLEQHGPHLPLFTDSLLVTHVARAVEAKLPEKLLITPTLWLGASGHHLAFAGSLSATPHAYMDHIASLVQALTQHGFYKFYVLNGHGGNTELNGLALRGLKEANPDLQVGHSGYFAFAADAVAQTLSGPLKEIKHACEAETSMMMHIHPELVRTENLVDDGFYCDPPVRGMIWMFDQQTEGGSLGYATLATADKGRILLDAAINGIVQELGALADGVALVERPR